MREAASARDAGMKGMFYEDLADIINSFGVKIGELSSLTGELSKLHGDSALAAHRSGGDLPTVSSGFTPRILYAITPRETKTFEQLYESPRKLSDAYTLSTPTKGFSKSPRGDQHFGPLAGTPRKQSDTLTTPRGVSTTPRATPRGPVLRVKCEELAPLPHHEAPEGCFGEDKMENLKKQTTSSSLGTSGCEPGRLTESLRVDGEMRMDTLLELYSKEFRIKAEWLGNKDDARESLALPLAHRSANSTASLLTQKGHGDTPGTEREHSFMTTNTYSSIEVSYGISRLIVQSPTQAHRLLWEMVGIAFVLYDLLTIPLLMAFDPPESSWMKVVDWIIHIFWTCNIYVSLTTGFVSHGVLVMNLRRIFIHYCKTWLVVDVFTVVPDWLFFLLSHLSGEDIQDSDNDAGALVRLLRFLRLFRLARLARIAKLRDAWNMLYDMIDSEKVGILVEIFKNILLLIMVNHFIGCLWYSIANAQGGDSWLKYHEFTRSQVTWFHQYLIAYHWSLTQFASSMHVQPQCVAERIFAICIVIFGIVGFSYFVGSITSSLARLRAMDEKRANDFWLLRKFLKHSEVPHELCVRIRSYVESRWEHQQLHSVSKNLDALNLLSEHLKAELACAIHGPFLRVHPLFQELHMQSRLTTQRLMLTGISQLSLAPQDTMFSAGENAKFMSILTCGTMQYERMHMENSYPEVVDSGEDWIAEPVLWVSGWCHIGDLRSINSTELLQVDPDKLFSIASLNPMAFLMLSGYSKEYAAYLNGIPREKLSDVSQGEDVSTHLRGIIQDVMRQLQLKAFAKRPERLRRRSKTSVNSGSRKGKDELEFEALTMTKVSSVGGKTSINSAGNIFSWPSSLVGAQGV